MSIRFGHIHLVLFDAIGNVTFIEGWNCHQLPGTCCGMWTRASLSTENILILVTFDVSTIVCSRPARGSQLLRGPRGLAERARVEVVGET